MEEHIQQKIININKLNNIKNNNYHKCIEEDWRNIYGERIWSEGNSGEGKKKYQVSWWPHELYPEY